MSPIVYILIDVSYRLHMIATNPTELGALLREGRQRKGLTQQDLANQLGTSRQWVIAAEAGSPNLRLALVIDALLLVDLLVDVIRDDSSQAILDAVFEARPCPAP
ncbi:MAG: helix-turn-helix domain-containing protein [Bifidobacteriaceae bacterium]|jgi:DNA-binding XRE family transcriptional regulator|nr:helix-turn-helix domain-containing protein [Bifidobacteriaceae bacterium]